MQLFERPEGGTRAILVHVAIDGENGSDDLAEFEQLVLSAGMEVITTVTSARHFPDNRYFIGSGKLEELQKLVLETKANIVMFNHFLSSSQERNLEKALNCAVTDRTGIILEIFAQRARTLEGRLQVELAQLKHTSTRLIRGWSHLDRQSAGVGVRGSPGDTQLEIDRRLIQTRVDTINRKLEKTRSAREQGKRARMRNAIPVVSLVGYTNAGKSTLFNRITHAHVLVADQMFATLDPTLRRVDLPGMGTTIMADTVGFIRRLPHRLVDAFRSTLEETAQADLLLHVVDAGASERDTNIAAVQAVLEEIGAGDVPVLEIFNKVDLLSEHIGRVDRDEKGLPVRVWVSATTGDGIDLLLAAIAERLAGDRARFELKLPPSCGRLRAKLYARNAVEAEAVDDEGNVLLAVRMPRSDLDALLREEKLSPGAVLVEASPFLAAAAGDNGDGSGSSNQTALADTTLPGGSKLRNDGEIHGVE